MVKNTEQMKQLKSLGHTLDTRFEGPFGIRFGLDALIGLVPVVGDHITSAFSLYILAQASAMGVSTSTLIRMGLNIAVENIFDMIPFVGNVFDVYWKANNKNLILLEKHLANPGRETIRSRTILALISLALVFLLIASGYVTFLIIEGIVHLIRTL